MRRQQQPCRPRSWHLGQPGSFVRWELLGRRRRPARQRSAVLRLLSHRTRATKRCNCCTVQQVARRSPRRSGTFALPWHVSAPRDRHHRCCPARDRRAQPLCARPDPSAARAGISVPSASTTASTDGGLYRQIAAERAGVSTPPWGTDDTHGGAGGHQVSTSASITRPRPSVRPTLGSLPTETSNRLPSLGIAGGCQHRPGPRRRQNSGTGPQRWRSRLPAAAAVAALRPHRTLRWRRSGSRTSSWRSRLIGDSPAGSTISTTARQQVPPPMPTVFLHSWCCSDHPHPATLRVCLLACALTVMIPSRSAHHRRQTADSRWPAALHAGHRNPSRRSIPRSLRATAPQGKARA